MPQNAKNRICDAAVRLFNEQDYDAVSLRQIADEAGVAIGTLTYHFSRKEDLINEVLCDLHKGFAAQFNEVAHGHELLAHLVHLFREAELNQERYPFYFRNMSEIQRSSEALGNENDEFSAKLCQYYAKSLSRLREDGYVRPELDDKRLATLAYVMLDLESSWQLTPSPFRNQKLPNVRLSRALVTLLSFCLVDERVTELEDLYAQLG